MNKIILILITASMLFTKGYAQGYEKGFKEGQMFLIQKFKTTLDSVEEILKSQKS